MLAELLQFDRTAIEAGEVYRLVTCHFVHWNFDHFFWDAAVFVLLTAIAWRIDPRRTLAMLGIASIAIPSVLWFTEPTMQTYRGLSGLDSALFAMIGVAWFRDAWTHGRRGHAAALIALGVGFVAKLGYEIATGQTLFVDSAAAGFTPIPMAHAVGAIVGAGVATRMAARLSHPCHQVRVGRAEYHVSDGSTC